MSFLAGSAEWLRAVAVNYVVNPGGVKQGLPRFFKLKVFYDRFVVTDKLGIERTVVRPCTPDDFLRLARSKRESDQARIDSYNKEIGRLKPFHPDPERYYWECITLAHDSVKSKTNRNESI